MKMQVTEEAKYNQLDEFIEACCELEHGDSYLIAVLHRAQKLFGYLPREVMDHVAGKMGIPAAHIWGVATFYHYFNLTPPGRYTISVCLGTACYVKGAGQVLEAIKEELGIDVGETTDDGMFSLQGARCLGACGLAPVVMIEDKIHGDLTGKKVVELLKAYRKQVQNEK